MAGDDGNRGGEVRGMPGLMDVKPLSSSAAVLAAREVGTEQYNTAGAVGFCADWTLGANKNG